jgi:transposase
MGASREQDALLRWKSRHSEESYKRLEAGTFHLVQKAKEGRGHVEINSAELALMLEGIELEGAKRRKRYVPQVEPEK